MYRAKAPRRCEAQRQDVARRWALLVAAVAIFGSGNARAAGPLGQNGAAITTSDYAIDMFQGPVFAGSRVTGLAGAYVAVAEDVDGNLQTPVAPAVRPFFSIDYFDYWLGFGLTFPGALENMDFFNSGAETRIFNSPDSFVFLTPALNLQWGTFGIGGTAEIQSYSFAGATTAEGAPQTQGELRTYIWTTHFQAANAFLDNQLIVGLGSRLLALSLNSTRDNGEALFTTTGAGLEVGALWKPTGGPYRIGAAFRSPIDTRAAYSDDLLPNAEGDLLIDGTGTPFYLPKRVALPWDANVGVAVQFGPRPLNPVWRTPEDLAERTALRMRLRALDRKEDRNRRLAEAPAAERDAIEAEFADAEATDERELEKALAKARIELERKLAEMPRFYVLVSGSALISGKVADAVGVESFLAQEVNRSGRRIAVSPRLGVESEVWPDVLKLRGGSYLEPTRFDTSDPRLHGTVGVDLRLVNWSVFGLFPDNYVWRVGGAADMAERYLTWGVTLGGWYPRPASSGEERRPVDPAAPPAR